MPRYSFDFSSIADGVFEHAQRNGISVAILGGTEEEITSARDYLRNRYPIVLHVFYFRVILDHGILGLTFLLSGFYVVLRSNGLSRSLAFALLIQGIINGLSVSGLANTYFFLALVLVSKNYAGPRPAPLEDTR